MLRDRQVRVVEAEAPRRRLAASSERDGGLEQLAGDDLALEAVGDLHGRLGGVAEVGEEAVRAPAPPPVGGDQRERRCCR